MANYTNKSFNYLSILKSYIKIILDRESVDLLQYVRSDNWMGTEQELEELHIVAAKAKEEWDNETSR